jgi:hypothetical protein
MISIRSLRRSQILIDRPVVRAQRNRDQVLQTSEAPAVQPHSASEEPGFSVLSFDTSANEVGERRYVLAPHDIVPGPEEYVRTLRSAATERMGQYELTKGFLDCFVTRAEIFNTQSRST